MAYIPKGTVSDDELAQRFTTKMDFLPPIEFSYETSTSHKKTQLRDYDVGLLIPRSKKYIAWFTFIHADNVCILLEIDRHRQIVRRQLVNVEFDPREPHMALGTFFYGSLVPSARDSHTSLFVVEDLLMYKSLSVRQLPYGDRLGILYELFQEYLPCPFGLRTKEMNMESPTNPVNRRLGDTNVVFSLPVMFDTKSPPSASDLLATAGYPIHHIQYRSFLQMSPYMNQHWDEFCAMARGELPVVAAVQNNPRKQEAVPPRSKFPETKPTATATTTAGSSYRETGGRGKGRTCFWVTADLTSDTYYLVHPHGEFVTDVAYIPNYTTSVFMNSLFRNIKENRNLDAMEESDDEEDFVDIRCDKYVDVTKKLKMECAYHSKFRRWVPLRVVE